MISQLSVIAILTKIAKVGQQENKEDFRSSSIAALRAKAQVQLQKITFAFIQNQKRHPKQKFRHQDSDSCKNYWKSLNIEMFPGTFRQNVWSGAGGRTEKNVFVAAPRQVIFSAIWFTSENSECLDIV